MLVYYLLLFILQDIFDAKAACDHLNGFNVMGRYLIVLYYQPNKITKKMNLQKREEELKELKRFCIKVDGTNTSEKTTYVYADVYS